MHFFADRRSHLIVGMSSSVNTISQLSPTVPEHRECNLHRLGSFGRRTELGGREVTPLAMPLRNRIQSHLNHREHWRASTQKFEKAPMRHAVFLWLLAAVFLGPCIEATSADDSEEAGIEYRIAQIAAGSGGVYTYTANQWGLLRVVLTNHRDHPVDLLCMTYFDNERTLQFGRRIWLPAQCQITTWHPIHLPEFNGGGDQPRIPFHTLVSEVGDSDNEFVRDEVGKLQYAGELRIARHQPIAGFIQHHGLEAEPPGVGIEPSELVGTARMDFQSPRQVSRFGDRLLPPSQMGFAPLHQLVIADDRMLGDASALAAIRQWLYSGGRLWIMLDRVDPELLSALLGDESGCHVVDTVTLNELHISGDSEHGVYDAEFEQPLKLVRVIVDEEDVPILVNGWPAAFTKQCGQGQLIVTTLESAAWVRRKSVEEMNAGQGEQSAWPFASIPAFQELMGPYFGQMPEASTVSETLEPIVRDYIGYSIPSRWLVMGLLAATIALLAVSGIWLWKAEHLERLTFVVPGITIAAAAVLILIGRQNRQAVPPTTAVIQIVRSLPGTDDVRISGNAGLYSTDSDVAVLEGENGGWVFPELAGTEGTIRRLIWSDLERWEWEGLPQAPGLRAAEFQTSLQTQQRLSAHAAFGPSGVSGTLATPDNLEPQDAVLVTEAGRIGVRLNANGAFTAASDEVLGSDEYLAAGLMSDDQARRSGILAELLQQREFGRVSEPTLYFWTAPWDAGFRFDENAQHSGSALVAVPLEFARPEVGTQVSLPAPLLPYRAAIGPDGHLPAGLFDNRDLLWLAKPSPATGWIRCEIPQVLLPVEIESARIIVRVTGPVGKLELSVSRDNQIVPLQTWIDPVGTLTLDLDGSQLPALDDAGYVYLRVAGGDSDRPELYEPDPESGKLNYWRIDSLTMELQVVVVEQEPSGASDSAP